MDTDPNPQSGVRIGEGGFPRNNRYILRNPESGFGVSCIFDEVLVVREGVRGTVLDPRQFLPRPLNIHFVAVGVYCSNRSAIDQPMLPRSPSRSTDPDLQAVFVMPYHFTPLGGRASF